jgi:hypothetical protein
MFDEVILCTFRLQIIPSLHKIVEGLRGVKDIKPDTPELVKLRSWLGKLQNRSIHEKLNEQEARELGFDAQSMLDCLKSRVKRT